MSDVFGGMALAVAVLALVQARRAAREVARLTDLYWQLKYEHGELKATVLPPHDPPPPAGPATAFVPLATVKRSKG